MNGFNSIFCVSSVKAAMAYYTEFKKDTKLASKFGINEMYEKNGELKPVKSDAIRKKGLTQNNYGALYNVNYKDALWDVMGGFSMATLAVLGMPADWRLAPAPAISPRTLRTMLSTCEGFSSIDPCFLSVK